MKPHRVRPVGSFDGHAAAVCIPGIGLILLAGVIIGRPTDAVILAASAYSVAFSVTRRVGAGRWGAMILTGVGMTAVSFAGTLAGLDPVAEVVGTAIMAAFAGALARSSGDRSWIWLQLMIAFLVAAQFPGDPPEAMRRAALVAGGAGIQMLAVRIMATIIGDIPAITVQVPADVTPSDIRYHAVRTVICVTGALLLSRLLGLSHGYWAPMTAMLILKPGLHDTWTRGLGRIAGTLCGVVIATAIARMFHGQAEAMVVMVTVAAAASFGLQQARYAIFSTFVTMCIVLLLALGGASILATDTDRVFGTLLGGLLAIIGAAIPLRRHSRGGAEHGITVAR